MKLSARILGGVASVNNYAFATEANINAGDAGSVYLQLVDLDQNLPQFAWNPPGLRYIPAAGATLAVQFQNIDATKQFTRYATTPFAADDRSIWQVPILASDTLDGTQSIKVVLTEGAVIRSFFLPASILVSSTNLCGC